MPCFDLPTLKRTFDPDCLPCPYLPACAYLPACPQEFEIELQESQSSQGDKPQDPSNQEGSSAKAEEVCSQRACMILRCWLRMLMGGVEVSQRLGVTLRPSASIAGYPPRCMHSHTHTHAHTARTSLPLPSCSLWSSFWMASSSSGPRSWKTWILRSRCAVWVGGARSQRWLGMGGEGREGCSQAG